MLGKRVSMPLRDFALRCRGLAFLILDFPSWTEALFYESAKLSAAAEVLCLPSFENLAFPWISPPPRSEMEFVLRFILPVLPGLAFFCYYVRVISFSLCYLSFTFDIIAPIIESKFDLAICPSDVFLAARGLSRTAFLVDNAWSPPPKWIWFTMSAWVLGWSISLCLWWWFASLDVLPPPKFGDF